MQHLLIQAGGALTGSSASPSEGLFTPAALRVCNSSFLGEKKQKNKNEKHSHAFMQAEHSECIVSVYCRESQLFCSFAGTNILPPPPPLPPAAPPGVPRLLLQPAGRGSAGGPRSRRRVAHFAVCAQDYSSFIY